MSDIKLGLKNGAKPLSSKPSSKTLDDLRKEFNKDDTALSPALQEELDRKGLEAHWIAPHNIRDGWHKKGWMPYKPETPEINYGSYEWKLGLTPDGFLKRGNMILGVKPKEAAQQHRELLRHDAKMLKASVTGQMDSKIRQAGKAAGIDVNVKTLNPDNEF